MIISSCHVSNKNNNNQIDTTNQSVKWYRIALNNTVIDSIGISKGKNGFGKMENLSSGKYKFYFHNISNDDYVYCDFIGLIDSSKGKWVMKSLIKDSVDKYGLIFPEFNGGTSDGRYFLFTTGDAGGSGVIMIYNNHSQKVFEIGVLGFKNHWSKDNKFEFWNVVHNDTLPKLENDDSWCQKFIWQNENVKETDSIVSRYVE